MFLMIFVVLIIIDRVIYKSKTLRKNEPIKLKTSG